MEKKASFKLPQSGYAGVANTRDFEWTIDEPENLGGTNLGPTPMEGLYAALASCIAITLRMYANRKGWDTGEIEVEVYLGYNNAKEKVIYKSIIYEKADELSEDQINRLDLIAKKCPVSHWIQEKNVLLSI